MTRSCPDVPAFRSGAVPVTHWQAAESAGPPRSLIYRFYLFYHDLTYRTLFDNIGYCKPRPWCVRWRFIQHAAFSVQPIRAPQIGSVAEFSSPTAASDGLAPAPCPRPLGPEPGVSPFRFQDTGRPGTGPPVKSRAGVTASRWPYRGDVTRGRDHRLPALPPGPLPNRCPLLGVCRCARAPTGLCQGLSALTQRSPR